MTALTKILAGARIKADDIAAVAPLSAYKSADQTLTTLTLTNDDALFVPLEANTLYLWLLVLSFTGGTAGSSDLKTGWTYPSGTTALYGRLGTPPGSSLLFQKTVQSDQPPYQSGGSGTEMLMAAGTISTGSTAGDWQLQWCTNTSPAVATTVHAGSVLAAWAIG